MIELIRPGVPRSSGMWADLGAGTGNFTWALRDLLAPTGTIYAIDRDGKAIQRQRELLEGAGAGAAVVPVQADFTRPLDPALFPGRRLPQLDGVLMANALHFVRDQAATLGLVASYLRAPSIGQPGGRVLLVEYDLRDPIAWVPFPAPFERFRELAAGAGLSEAELVGRRVSPSSGVAMYAAVAVKTGSPYPR
jgi:SAM-dependent methyltransferase